MVYRRVYARNQFLSDQMMEEPADPSCMKPWPSPQSRPSAPGSATVNRIPSEKFFADLRKPVGESPKWREVLNKADRVAVHDVPVLLYGESGTGKEELARYIHAKSTRHNKPFLAFNCAALHHELAASELFGYAAGTFTGALKEGKGGLFEAADGGTLFLDEISELPPTVQAMLLRVLQEKQVARIGEYRSRPLNVRIIAATNLNLEDAVKKGNFRLDLFYRLNTVTLELPPLRERIDDIPLLAAYFLRDRRSPEGEPYALSQEALQCLVQYHWPGNVRELKNAVEHAVLFADSQVILPCHLPKAIANREEEEPSTLLRLGPGGEREHILRLLQFTRYNISRTAKLLGISRGTLYKKLKEYRIPL